MSTSESPESIVTHGTSAGSIDVDVLIVGGGPAGLCASIALSRLGIESLVVERHVGTAIHPKALHLSTRTMELFRAWDIADDVRAVALPMTDHAMFLGRSLADPDFVRHPIWPADDSISPECSRLVSQEVLEPVLLDHARRGIGDIAFRTRLTTLTQDRHGVIAEIENLTDDTRRRVRARYVIGADGADSTVRRIAGIEFPGKDIHHSINIRFTADLSDLLRDRRSAFYYVQNDVVRGLLPVIDNGEDWRLHIVLESDTPAEHYAQPARQLELIRAAVGVADLEPTLLPGFPWTAGARVARQYRDRRTFLVGDAAHVNPPAGGLGMNCGIQDAHNLVWKLAAVLAGRGDDALLDSYEDERRPVALRTVLEAQRNHEYEAAPVHTDSDRRRKHDRRRQLGLVLGHYYESTAIVPDGTTALEVDNDYSEYVPCARPGHRAPHLWVDSAGERRSLLDLFAVDRATVVTASPGIWESAAEVAGARLVSVDGTTDPTEFRRLYGIGTDGAVIVRPDGVVSARTVGRLDDVDAESFVRAGTLDSFADAVRQS